MKNIRIFIAILTFIWLATAMVFGQDQPTPTPADSTSDVPTQTTPQDTPSVEPKMEGVVRIGLVTPKTQLGQNNSGQETSEPVRQLFASFIKGPTVETVVIEARTPAQINVEAQQKGCDFVLYSSISQKQKTGIFGNLIKIVVPVITSTIPAGDTNAGNGQGDTISGAAQQSGQNMIKAVAESVKAKDVLTLEFSLMTINGNKPIVKNSLKAKAISDGEDVLSPLIEQASATITEAIINK